LVKVVQPNDNQYSERRALVRNEKDKDLANLIEETETNIEGSWQRFSRFHDDVLQGLQQESKQDYIDHIYDDIALYGNELPNFTRQALYIMLYSRFESDLDSLCEFSGKRANLKLKPRDISGRGVERSHNYLKKVLDVNPGADFWERIKIHNRIRNQIVHNNGFISSEHNDYKPVSSHIGKNPLGIELQARGIMDNYAIILNKGSLTILHEDTIQFMNSVYSKLPT
jgi:hypothetical protein